MQSEGVVGTRRVSRGALAPIALGGDTETLVTPLHPQFMAAVLEGRAYAAAVSGSAGVDPGTALTATAAFSLYNPKSSGLNLVVWAAMLAYVSGTLPAGAIYYCAIGNIDAPTGGAELVPVNLLVGRPRGVALPRAGAVLSTAPTLVRPFCSLAPILASSVVAPWVVRDPVNGAFVVPPGACLSLHGSGGGGSSPLVSLGMEWEEIPE